MSCDNLLGAQDLKDGKEDITFISEVSTSRAGGVSTGAPIETATNRFGETSDTLQGRLNKLGVIYSDPTREWVANDDTTQLEATSYLGNIYVPTAPLPFNNGSVFDTSQYTLYSGTNEQDIAELLSRDGYARTLTLADAVESTSAKDGDYIRIIENNFNLYKYVETATPDNIFVLPTDSGLFLERQKESETNEDITYFVSPDGDNSNDGLTVTTPFRTINYAISKIPTLIKNNVVIDLHSAKSGIKNYDEDVFVSAAFRQMDVVNGQYGSYAIQGDGENTKVRSVTVVKSDVSLSNFEVQQVAPVISSETGGIIFWWCSGEAAAANISFADGFDNIGINAFASNVELRTLNLNNTTRAVRSKRGAKVQIRFCFGEVDASLGGAVYDATESSEIVINDNSSVTNVGGAWYDGDQGCVIWDRDKGQIITGAQRVIPEVVETSLKVTKPNTFNNTPIAATKTWADRTAIETGDASFTWSSDNNNSSGWTHNLYRASGGWTYANDGFGVMELVSEGMITGFYAESGVEDTAATIEQVYSWDKPTAINTSSLTLTYRDGSSLVSQRVRVGAENSGGTGQRILTINN